VTGSLSNETTFWIQILLRRIIIQYFPHIPTIGTFSNGIPMIPILDPHILWMFTPLSNPSDSTGIQNSILHTLLTPFGSTGLRTIPPAHLTCITPVPHPRLDDVAHHPDLRSPTFPLARPSDLPPTLHRIPQFARITSPHIESANLRTIRVLRVIVVSAIIRSCPRLSFTLCV